MSFATLSSLRIAGLPVDLADHERERVHRDRHYHTHTVPVLRLTGMAMLAAVVALHNAFILKAFATGPYLALLALLGVYCTVSWLLLARFYVGDRPVTLGDVFLIGDIGVFVMALYASGGERSWLLPVLTARVADQAYSSFRRVRFFAHATVAGYALLVAYLMYVERRPIDARAEVAKIGLLYAVNMYVAFTARTAELLRRRSAEAVDIARDLILQLRANRDKLEEQRARAEEASAYKSAFLANMSHEIRTPLNGILGMTELALDGQLAPDLRDQLQTVRDSGRALLRIVNDVLDFSRIEAGRLDFEEAPFELRDWLGEIVRSTQPLAQAKGLELSCAVDAAVPDRLLGDAGRLRQVLVNLLGNAIKFTPAGSVAVTVDVEGTDVRGLTLRCAVSDTGIGVPPDRRAAIFEAFTQADGTLTRRFGGTGLGLAISSRLVAHMEGRLWVECPPSGGSVFQFTARLKEASEPLPAPVDPAAARGRRVLVSAESAAAAERWRAALEALGCHASTAGLGRPAFTMLERLRAAGTPVDLVVLDTDGSDIDVLTVAEKILGEPAYGAPRVVVAVGRTERGDAARARELDLPVYLQKPVEDEALAQAALRALAAGRLEAPAARAALVPSRRLRILLAEDNAVNVKVASRLLEGWGHQVVVANDGTAALAQIEAGPFDLALLDVQMPGMTGLEVAQHIRDRERMEGRAPLPLVALTAHALGADRERCFAAGMTGYVTKPVEAAVLFDAIESEVGGTVVVLPASGSGAGRPSTDAPFDPELALERAGGDPDFMRELCRIMLDDLGRLPSELRSAVERQDAAAAEMAAHQLKGNCASFAAEPSRAAAAEVELAAHAGDFPALSGGLDRLERELGRLRAALQAQASGA